MLSPAPFSRALAVLPLFQSQFFAFLLVLLQLTFGAPSISESSFNFCICLTNFVRSRSLVTPYCSRRTSGKERRSFRSASLVGNFGELGQSYLEHPVYNMRIGPVRWVITALLKVFVLNPTSPSFRQHPYHEKPVPAHACGVVLSFFLFSLNIYDDF